MTTTAKFLIKSKRAEDAQTTQYTCAVLQTIIDNFTVTNTSVANAVFSVNIVDGGDSLSDDNCLLHEKILIPNESYRAFEVIGHTLSPDSYISTLTDVADALTIRASGREIT